MMHEHALRTKRAILAAAAVEFAAHGYAGAGIDAILRRAGVSKGAFYFHFESKHAVADAVLEHANRHPQHHEDLQRLIAAVAADTGTLGRAALRLTVETLMSTWFAPGPDTDRGAA
jgi:AcrR family transcriptional regulator